MRTVNEQKQELARALFFQSGKSQGEIAVEVGVSNKTLYLWTKEGDWNRLRSASNLMPSLIIENFYAQVQELNNDIRSRPPGKRYPSLQEAEIFRKIMLTIDRSKKKATQPEYMELFQKFLSWIVPKSDNHSKLFTNYADSFLKSQATQGFHPYDIEYEEPLFEDNKSDIEMSNDAQLDEYYTEPSETLDIQLASLQGTKQFHKSTMESPNKAEPLNVTSPLERPGEVDPPQPVIIGNYDITQQPNENQSFNPENEASDHTRSEIINESKIGNNDVTVEDPRDIYKGLSPGQAYQKYLALKKEKELNNAPDEKAPDQPPKEETQLYSIGEKIFTMRVKK